MTSKSEKWPRAVMFDEIVASLLEWQPSATDIMPSGLCPFCKEDTEVSYIIPELQHKSRNGNEEMCGYYCGYCGWGNAGVRDIKK